MLSYIIIASLLQMLVAFVGLFFVFLGSDQIKKYVYYFISFSVGTFLGVVFFDLLPEAVELTEHGEGPMWILGGFLLFYILGRFLFWYHHHHSDTECDHGVSKESGVMVLTADVLHNFIDGILIAGAFMADTHLGVVTTIAVLFHELPQEISDFFVLVHSGMSKARALALNFLVSCSTLFGAMLGYFALSMTEGWVGPLLGIAAGNFLYIAASDLLPELNKSSNAGKRIVQISLVFLGVFIMLILTTLFGHGHE